MPPAPSVNSDPVTRRRSGYDRQATSKVFDSRWLRTGDLGRLDDDGFLYLTGRKKDLIITAGGKNVAPAVLEDRLREHWLIEDCVVVGDQRPYIAALVTLDPATFARWKRRQGKPANATIADLGQDPDLLAAVREAVDQANAGLSRQVDNINQAGCVVQQGTGNWPGPRVRGRHGSASAYRCGGVVDPREET